MGCDRVDVLSGGSDSGFPCWNVKFLTGMLTSSDSTFVGEFEGAAISLPSNDINALVMTGCEVVIDRVVAGDDSKVTVVQIAVDGDMDGGDSVSAIIVGSDFRVCVFCGGPSITCICS